VAYPEGIDPQTAADGDGAAPYNPESFAQMRVTDTWRKYKHLLRYGQGQCNAILDDGCDLSAAAWQVELPWGPKVVATWNAIDGNADCSPVPPGYHGTSVGYPSSIHCDNVLGVAYNNCVAPIRCVTVVHLTEDESATMAAGLHWVLDNHERLNITAVNLSPLDDQRHQQPVPTVIDAELAALRAAGIWVGAPAGNHHYTDGISWPACQPHCFGMGATRPGEHAVHLDRYANIDLLVCAQATSSSNAYGVACSQLLRELIAAADYAWQDDGETLPDAMMAIFQRTGVPIDDPESGLTFRELDLLAAADHVCSG
jgi:hypothetical protein